MQTRRTDSGVEIAYCVKAENENRGVGRMNAQVRGTKRSFGISERLVSLPVGESVEHV